jgi:hypothetical protein
MGAPGSKIESGKKAGRFKERAPKRVLVRYGLAGPERSAFTKNVSESGLFLQTNLVFKPGTTIQVLLQFPDCEFSMWARVVWAKRVPPELAHVLQCGMGLCFVDPNPEWLRFFREWTRRRPRT